jgi:hypothetical protein
VKRLLLIVGLAIAALGFSVAPAAASSPAVVSPFTATYLTVASNGVDVSIYTCSGNHVDNNGKGLVKQGFLSQDSETCQITGNTAGYVAGTYSGNPLGTLPPIGVGNVAWFSDFNGVQAASWTITIVDNLNGTFTANILAFYTTP